MPKVSIREIEDKLDEVEESEEADEPRYKQPRRKRPEPTDEVRLED